MDASWIDKLQVPGLILAAGVIYMLFRLLMKMVDFGNDLLKQVSEQRATLAEVVSLLRHICIKAKISGGQE